MDMRSKLKFGSFLAFSIFASFILIIDSVHVSATVPYVTERVSLTSSGAQTSGSTQYPPTISQDGRYVAFTYTSSDIVAGDTNGVPDVFVRDRKLGTTVRANLSSAGTELSKAVSGYAMSANGRFVIFEYSDSGVVPGDTNNKSDIFLRDLKNNTTEMVSLTSSGGLSNDEIIIGDISADGRYIVFTSAATNLVSGDINGSRDVFVRDRKLGTTTLLSKSDTGVLGNSTSLRPSISCDGSYVVFSSLASNLVSGDTNGTTDVFLIDRVADKISNITMNGNGASGSNIYNSDISCNGQTVVFYSSASNLVVGDTNNTPDVFAYNMIDDTFERVNLDSSGSQTFGNVPLYGTNLTDFSGRYVVFETSIDTLVPGDTNTAGDIFLRDLVDGTTQILSKRSITTQTGAYMHSNIPAISSDGREVIFRSLDPGLVTGDTNGYSDLFVSKTGI